MVSSESLLIRIKKENRWVRMGWGRVPRLDCGMDAFMLRDGCVVCLLVGRVCSG